jgi:hypothetical protein
MTPSRPTSAWGRSVIGLTVSSFLYGNGTSSASFRENRAVSPKVRLSFTPLGLDP